MSTLRSRILLIVATGLVLLAAYHYGSGFLRHHHEQTQERTLQRLQSFWPKGTLLTSSLEGRAGIVWLRPLAEDNLANAVIGRRQGAWFVAELFHSDREAQQAFDLRTFVSNPPATSHYYPSVVGSYVLISSSSNTNIALAKLLASS